MRMPELITQEIQSLDKIIVTSKELSIQFPQDNILQLSIKEDEYRRNELILELKASLEHYGQHSLKYKGMKM